MPPPLAITDVRYVGDPVALVVAESRYVAEDACELIEVDYDPQQAVVDYATRGRRHRDTSCTRAGASSRTRWCRCRSRRCPPTSTRRSRRPRTSSSATIEQNRYLCVPMETRGIIAVVERRARRDRHRVRDAVGARDP